ncbi:MAG: hypothetical protein R3179_09745, partial [Sedimenticolaceae bacterium]|nr:hypothetical protein [Sedimenticolaceae bacterium]
MINPERFGDKRDLAMHILDQISSQLTQLLGKEVHVELVSEVDDVLLARMEEIEEEIFRIEDNVYTENDLLECLA